jgi:regulator of sigma D
LNRIERKTEESINTSDDIIDTNQTNLAKITEIQKNIKNSGNAFEEALERHDSGIKWIKGVRISQKRGS